MDRTEFDWWTFARSCYGGWRQRQLFANLRLFTLFVGQPLSGAALVGSLLNAHRHACLSQELHVMKYLQQGYGRSQLRWLIYHRDRELGRRGQRDKDYQYAVPGQWQGGFERLDVLGDVKAGSTTDLLRRQSDVLAKLRDTMQVPVRMVHVVRNPFDVIAAHHRRRLHLPLDWAIERYFDRCTTNWQLEQESRAALLTLRWEELMAMPRQQVTILCRHLDLSIDPAYLDACQLVVHEQVHKPRFRLPTMVWSRKVVDHVLERMKRFPFLHGYSFPGTRALRRAA